MASLFRKSAASSEPSSVASSGPKSMSDADSSLRQELKELKGRYEQANEVGVVFSASSTHSITVCVAGNSWSERESVRAEQETG